MLYFYFFLIFFYSCDQHIFSVQNNESVFFVDFASQLFSYTFLNSVYFFHEIIQLAHWLIFENKQLLLRKKRKKNLKILIFFDMNLEKHIRMLRNVVNISSEKRSSVQGKRMK